MTILDFAKEIILLASSEQKIVFKPLPIDDPMQRQPDISLAKKLLNWEPKVSRKEGMKATFDYFKSLNQEELYKKDHKDFSNYNKT